MSVECFNRFKWISQQEDCKGGKAVRRIVVFICFLILCATTGCAKTGEGTYQMSVATIAEGFRKGKLVVNDGAPDLSGTYKGADGTVTIRKTDQAMLFESTDGYGFKEVALPSEPAPAGYKKIGMAKDAYLVTAELGKCQANIKDRVIALREDGSGQILNGYMHSYTKKGNDPITVGINIEGSTLTLDYPMSTIRTLSYYYGSTDCGWTEFKKVSN